MVDAQVAVVGGGPAGAAAAITLGRAGCDVVLVDRARFPRDKCCGDGLTVAALRELESLGLRPETVPGWQTVQDVFLRSPSGRVVHLPLPRRKGQFAVCVPRLSLDAALLDLARAAGAKVLDGHALRGAVADGDAVQLEVSGLDPLRVRYVIGADGAWSPLRKALGANLPGYLGDWHAFRQYFSGCGPAASDMWVWFEPDLLPGYMWSFPLPDGRANVGFGLERNEKFDAHRMGELWPELLQRPHVREVLGDGARAEGSHKAWPIPARVRAAALTAADGRALFVGDAACATDPLTGEGIAQALLTGRRAAEAILGGGPEHPERVRAAYERDVRHELFADHRFGDALSRGLSHRKGARIAIRAAGLNAWTRRNFARWLFEDYPRALLGTPRRWRRQVLTAPGAYQDQGAGR
ncbi:MAG: NAD(P)/FAD-dependent oxidoreductase [Acidimicrobiales bacterium]